MGLSSSKRVSRTLRNSADFNSACDSVYEDCLALTQHAFPGVKPYQLFSASENLHRSLSSLPLIHKWVPTPPTRSQVDKALTRQVEQKPDPIQEKSEITLGSGEFKEFAVDLFTDAVVSNAGKAILRQVPIGVIGILGVGGLTRSGKELVGAAIGVYALGVSTSIYLGLAG
ncbi:hypothetical protein LguiA_002738 [Lonicera macranthoides]